MLEFNYALPDDKVDFLKNSIEEVKQQVSEFRNMNYSADHIEKLKEDMIQNVVDKYDSAKGIEEDQLREKILDLKEQFEEKFYRSKEAEKELALIRNQIELMSDEELEFEATEYNAGKSKNNHPLYQDEIGRQLKARNIEAYKLYRKMMLKNRDGNQSFLKIDAELTRRFEELNSTPYGQMLLQVKSPSNNNTAFIKRNIRELFE